MQTSYNFVKKTVLVTALSEHHHFVKAIFTSFSQDKT